MEALQGAFLGILQGITEWLPVSSEGQTMIAMIGWLGIPPFDALSFSIFLHLGTMMTVLIRFRHEFLRMIREMNSKLTRIVIVSTLCTGVTGVPLFLLFRESFIGGRQATVLIGLLLVATGLLLRFGVFATRGTKDMAFQDMVLLMRGIRQEDALIISFIISVPAVLGGIMLIGLPGSIPWETASVMLGSSFLIGFLTMDLLIRLARDVSFSKILHRHWATHVALGPSMVRLREFSPLMH